MPRKRRFPRGKASGLGWEGASRPPIDRSVVEARWQGRCRECGGFYPPGALIVYRHGTMTPGERSGYVHAEHVGVRAS